MRLYTLFDNSDTFATAHVTSNLSSNLIPVHEQDVKIPLVVDRKLLVAVRKKVTCLSTKKLEDDMIRNGARYRTFLLLP